MMGLYASQNIRCLMLELYQIGQYVPALNLEAYQCVPTGCEEDDAN